MQNYKYTTGKAIASLVMAASKNAVRVLAGAVGLGCISLETGLNVVTGGDLAVLAGTLAAPVLAAATLLLAEWSWHGGQRVRAGLVLVGGLALLAVVLSNSLHRTALAQQARIAEAADGLDARQRIEGDLKTAKDDVKAYKGKVATETANGGCGPVCKGYEAQQAEAETKAASLETRLAAAPHPVEGVDAVMLSDLTRGLVSERRIEEWKPALLPLGLSLAGIFALGLAFAPGQRRPAPEAAPAEAEADAAAELTKAARCLMQVLKSGGVIGSMTELAELADVHISNASRAVTSMENAGVVRRHKDGRRVAIRLAA